MKTHSYSFPFGIGQEVEIIAIQVAAVILGVSKNIDGDTYRIVYYFNGVRYDLWVHGMEIRAKE
jgi:hypothetical protein